MERVVVCKWKINKKTYLYFKLTGQWPVATVLMTNEGEKCVKKCVRM